MAGEHYEEKERFDGLKVKILMPELASGSDQDCYQWRKNIDFVNIGEESKPIDRYLKTAERYFYSKEGFGSEKRKNPA
jgi:hypothetical protein